MKLTSSQTRKLLSASYKDELVDVDEFKIDKPLSSFRVKVYTIDNSNDVVVVHRGSQDRKDWYDNLQYGLNLDPTYSKTFKIHEERHKRAVDKYGAENIISVGHSRGALYADKLHKQGLSRYNINLNKPTNIRDRLFDKNAKNQTNAKSTLDPVSILQNNDKNSLIIKSKTLNPFTEHSSKVLERLDENKVLGGNNKHNNKMLDIFKNSINWKKLKVKELKDYIKLHKKDTEMKLNITRKTKKELIDIVKKLI